VVEIAARETGIMKLIKKINNLFSYDRYYKMSVDNLVKEAHKYDIGGYFNGNIIRREKIIEQLIAKDNASMFKRSLIISTFTLIVAAISLIISVIAMFLK